MICVKLYEQKLTADIQVYKTNYLNPLSGYTSPDKLPVEVPKLSNDGKVTAEYTKACNAAFVRLKQEQKHYTTLLQQLKSIKVPAFNFDALSIVNKHYEDLQKANETKRQQILSSGEQQKAQRKASVDAKVAEANAHNEQLLVPIRTKHEELLAYKDQLSYVFDHYGVTPLDMDISDTISIKEFGALVDASIEVCNKYQKKESGIFNKLTKPLNGNTNLAFAACYLGMSILVLYFLLPIACIPTFALFCMSIHGMYQDLDKLRIARALMSQLDYQRFVPKEEFLQADGTCDVTDIDEDVNSQLAEIVDYTEEHQKAIAELNSASEIGNKSVEVTAEVKGAYAETITKMENYMTKIENALREVTPHIKNFPSMQSDSVVMSHTYVLSTTPEGMDVVTPIPFKNLIFDDTDRVAAINRMKLYLANTLLNVRVKQLSVEIYDPLNMCADFTEFLVPETKEFILPNSSTIEELMRKYRGIAQTNVINLHGKTIDEFNIDAEKRELVPVDYKLLIVVSGFEKIADGDSGKLFNEFFNFSMDKGVWVWLLNKQKRDAGIMIDGSEVKSGQPIKYTNELGDKATVIYMNALAKYKDRGIDYITKYGDKFIPKEKWWTWDTISEIYMPIGLENGDPTRGLTHPSTPKMGDANVHAILAGATGAGKSAAINQILMSLITMYPPSELQLVYVDFKNVEAAKFTRGYVRETETWNTNEQDKALKQKGAYYTRLSRIPHLYIISGTTDGEYALSIFEYLMAEMARRQKLINAMGKTKLEEGKKEILAQYNMEHGTKKTWLQMREDWDWYKANVYDKYGGDLPRLLIVLDEFQVMFNPEFVDSKIIDQINGKITAITKLARAMGCHFWFTSQSMKGTMSADTMGNFSLRMALRCSAETSNEIIGNPAAGTIKAKFGYMYSNDSAGQNKDVNHLWRVPFLAEERMPDYIDPLYELCEKRHEIHNMAEFYDEKILVPSWVMDDWYKNYPDAFSDPHTFILGERAGFSTNKAPLTTTLANDDGEGILIAAFDKYDLMNLTNTIISNIRHKEQNAIFLINCMDKDSYGMLEVDKIADPRFLELAGPNIDVPELLDALEVMRSQRLERGGPYTPMYITLVNWEKCPGLGVDKDYKLEDKFKALMRDCPGVGMHFIMAMREKGEWGRSMSTGLKHHLAGLLMQDSSAFFMNSTKCEKLPSADKDAGLFAIYEFGNTTVKFRIYQHEYTFVSKSREVVI